MKLTPGQLQLICDELTHVSGRIITDVELDVVNAALSVDVDPPKARDPPHP